MKFQRSINPKTAQLLIRVTPAEKIDIEEKAAIHALPVSAYILKVVQGRQTKSKLHLHLIEEVRQLGMQLKDIYQSEKPRSADELAPVMKSIAEAIDKIGNDARFFL